MPKKRKQKLGHHPTDKVIEELFPKKVVDHMKEVAHGNEASEPVDEPSQSPQQE
jgi:hypothetical protein